MKSLYIASVGFARPETRFEVGGAPSILPFSLPRQWTALEPKYLAETENRELFSMLPSLTETPTTLATRAVEQALTKAGVASNDVGLLLAATSTPLQTTPVESQRVGKELNLKIPAYDVCCGGADSALHLETLMHWRQESTPDYALAISTHIPTSRIDLNGNDLSRYFLSDAAGVALIAKNSGKYRVEHAEVRVFPREAQRFVIELYGYAKWDPAVEREIFLPQLSLLYRSLQPRLSKDVTVIESQLTPLVHEELRESIGSDRCFSYWSHLGHTLGAAPFASLALFEEEQGNSSEQILLLQSGIGLSVGVILLTREG